MQTNYDVQTLYDSTAINAMTRMTYDLYHPEIAGRIYMIAAALLLAGSMGSSSSDNPLYIILLALGCWVLIGANYGAKSTAKQIIASMKDNFPTMKFSFRQDNIVVTTPQETGIVHYDILTRLAENNQYLFLFSSERAAYVLDKQGFTTGSAEAFKTWLQGKTGLTFERSGGLRTQLRAAFRRKV